MALEKNRIELFMNYELLFMNKRELLFNELFTAKQNI